MIGHCLGRMVKYWKCCSNWRSYVALAASMILTPCPYDPIRYALAASMILTPCPYDRIRYALAASMAVFIMMDFWRLFIGPVSDLVDAQASPRLPWLGFCTLCFVGVKYIDLVQASPRLPWLGFCTLCFVWVKYIDLVQSSPNFYASILL